MYAVPLVIPPAPPVAVRFDTVVGLFMPPILIPSIPSMLLAVAVADAAVSNSVSESVESRVWDTAAVPEDGNEVAAIWRERNKTKERSICDSALKKICARHGRLFASRDVHLGSKF
jgi:hypothetical protein